MKSLAEQVNDIKVAKMSKTAKRAALVSLGLLNHEVTLIMSQINAATPPRPRAPRTYFTFGVEIECFVSPDGIRRAAQETGLSYQYQGYNHTDGLSYFKFVPDGSVSGLENPIECVSPILKGADGKKALQTACKTLRAADARVNRTCGLHVHIGARELTDEQYCNVFVNYAHLESLIDSFMAPSRRGNEAYYARSIKRKTSEIKTAYSRSSMSRMLCNCRYHKVNPVSYNAHGTIEFRQHQGTTDFDKIFNWVQFCGKLVEWSKTHRLDADVTSINDIEFLTAKEKAFFKQRAQTLADAVAA